MGPRSDFSKPCQGAAEKSANATRKALTARFRCGSQPVGMSTGRQTVHYLFLFYISIDCTGIEDELDVTMARQTELDYLIYNDPLGYADLILNSDPEGYLKNGTGSHVQQGVPRRERPVSLVCTISLCKLLSHFYFATAPFLKQRGQQHETVRFFPAA